MMAFDSDEENKRRVDSAAVREGEQPLRLAMARCADAVFEALRAGAGIGPVSISGPKQAAGTLGIDNNFFRPHREHPARAAAHKHGTVGLYPRARAADTQS